MNDIEKLVKAVERLAKNSANIGWFLLFILFAQIFQCFILVIKG